MRLNVISSLDAINSVVGVELLSQSLLPAIVELSQDSKWRVRLAIIENVPMLAKHFGIEFFNEKLIYLLSTWLVDDVYSIRRATAVSINNLLHVFGEPWIRSEIIPKMEKMHSNIAHTQRSTCCAVLHLLTPGLSSKTLEMVIVPILLVLKGDTVANVRFGATKAIHALVDTLTNRMMMISGGSTTGSETGLGSQNALEISLLSSLLPVVENLKKDSDRDVRFFAEKIVFPKF